MNEARNMRVRTMKRIFAAAPAAVPAAALAATPPALSEPGNLSEFVANFASIANFWIIGFLIGFGFFGVLIGLMTYAGAGGNEERMGKARARIIYGLIGMFVMFSFWGIVHLLTKTYLGV